MLRDTCYIDSGLPGNNERSRNDTKSYVSIYREALSECQLLPLICVGIEPDPIKALLICVGIEPDPIKALSVSYYP